MTPFKHSRFLYCSMPSFGVSALSPKKSSSFNIFSTSLIIFITCRNRNHMRNNIRYKGSVNNNSVIILLIASPVISCYFRQLFSRVSLSFLFMSIGDLTKLPAMVLLLGRASRRFLWCWLLLLLFLTGGFYVSGLLFLATGTPPWLLRPVKASTSSELYPGYFRLLYFCQAFPSQFYRERYGFEWAFFTVFYLTLLHRHFWHVLVTQIRAGTPHPGSSSVPALTELSLPADAWTWTTHIVVTRPLIYQLRQWATKCRFKIKLTNMFC